MRLHLPYSIHPVNILSANLPTPSIDSNGQGQGGNWPAFISRNLSGLALCSALATIGIWLGEFEWLQLHGFGTLTLAIIGGILVGNTFYHRLAPTANTGVQFAKQNLLRLGIVMYGLRLSTHDIGQVGLAGIVTDALVLSSTFTLAYLIGVKCLGMDRKTVALIGAGSSICGAAAVMATEPIVRGRSEQVTIAVATVVVFGTLAIFLYPVLFDLNQYWQLIPGGPNQFGIYIGSTVHEVAQVMAAARSIDTHAADTAVIAKMVRVMMLAPFLILLSIGISKGAVKHQEKTIAKPKITIPWFAFAFIGVVLLNSFLPLSVKLKTTITELDTFFLAMAMAALGLSTHISSIKKAGLTPLFLALILFTWLVVGGALINRWAFNLLS